MDQRYFNDMTMFLFSLLNFTPNLHFWPLFQSQPYSQHYLISAIPLRWYQQVKPHREEGKKKPQSLKSLNYNVIIKELRHSFCDIYYVR